MKELIERLQQLLQTNFQDNPWTCALATADAAGNPSVRIMILRELSVTGGLLFVSDRRTHKHDHLTERPTCEVCFWLPKQNVEARIRGEAVIVDAMDDESERQKWWSRMDKLTVRRYTHGDADHPDSAAMPSTFELITVTPTWIEIADFSSFPAKMSTWTA